MTTQYFLIDMRLPGLNEYIAAMNSNRHVGNKLKQDTEEFIMWAIKRGLAKGTLKRVLEPCDIYIEFREATKRRDVDNIQSAQKFILDALVKTGVLKNDGQRWVKQIYHRVVPAVKDCCIVYMIPAGQARLTIS